MISAPEPHRCNASRRPPVHQPCSSGHLLSECLYAIVSARCRRYFGSREQESNTPTTAAACTHIHRNRHG